MYLNSNLILKNVQEDDHCSKVLFIFVKSVFLSVHFLHRISIFCSVMCKHLHLGGLGQLLFTTLLEDIQMGLAGCSYSQVRHSAMALGIFTNKVLAPNIVDT